MNAYVTNLVRIGAAALVAYLAALLVHLGLHLGPNVMDAITATVVAVVAPLVLGVLSALERRFPWLTHILAVKGTPKPAPAAK